MAQITFTVCITEEQDGSYRAEVEQLPALFASGFSPEELKEAVEEAIQLSVPEEIMLDEVPGAMTTRSALPGRSGSSRRRRAGACSSRRRHLRPLSRRRLSRTDFRPVTD
jgi:predicted RNase H-like HicB family nuclease